MFFSLGCSHQTPSTTKIDREAVRKSLDSFKSSYESEFKKDETLEGVVNVASQIHKDGVAKNVHIVPEKTSLQNLAVQDCVVQKLSLIQFPEHPKGTVAEVAGYPLKFSKMK